DDAADPLPARIGVREMVSDIAQVGRAKQGIADGMQQHIRIRMAGSSLLGGQFQSAHKKRDSFFQLMDVVSKTKSKIHFVPRNYTARQTEVFAPWDSADLWGSGKQNQSSGIDT